MRVLSVSETRQALPMAAAIESMRMAFGSDTETPLRQTVGASLVMPGRVGDSTAVKVVSTIPGSPSGIVVVFNHEGAPVGIVDGPTLTAIRTAAGVGLVTSILAPKDASSFAMVGAGAMARDQIVAICLARNIDRIVVWSRDESRAEALASEFSGEIARTPQEAVHDMDIVTTATPSTVPLFSGDDLSDLVHINAIGAYLPSMVEIPADVVNQAYVVVDNLEAARAEAGDLIQANRVPDTDLETLLTMTEAPRQDRTLFKSVGVATQDVAAAVAALRNAEQMGIGTIV